MTLTDAEFRRFIEEDREAGAHYRAFVHRARRHFGDPLAEGGANTSASSRPQQADPGEVAWAAAAAVLGLDDPHGEPAPEARPEPLVTISEAEVADLRARAAFAPGSEAEWEHWKQALLC